MYWERFSDRATVVYGLLVAADLRRPSERVVISSGFVPFDRGVEEGDVLLVGPRERKV